MSTANVSLVTVEQELQAAIKIAKALGLNNGLAIDQAMSAVQDFTGVDLRTLFHVQEASGVAVKPCYGASELAALIGPGFNSRKINQILIQIGLQCEIKKRPYRNSKTERVVGYEPTDFGLEHAVLGKNGRMWVKHLKWRDTVIPLIKATMGEVKP